MRQVLVIILALFAFESSGQKIRPEIKKLAQKIEKYNELESDHVGYAGVTTDQYRNFEKLRDKATYDELLQLIEYKNSVVKGYSSWALADKKYPKLVDIFTEFLRTGESATTQHGCIVSEGDLASEFYSRVFYQHFHNVLSVEDSLFFQSQIQQLDSVILYAEKDNYLLRRALNNNNGNPNNYDRIRHLAFKKENLNAIEALAVYQKEQDIEDFKKLKEKSFVAIAIFPDENFWEFLLSFKDKVISKSYLMAISAFKTDKSAEILSDLLTTMPKDKISELTEALTKNYSAIYQPLILEIWEKYKMIDIRATKILIKDIPDKTSNSFTIGLLSKNKLNFVQYDHDYGTIDKILPLILGNIEQYQKDSLLKICETNIKTAEFTTLNHFLTCVKNNGLTETSDEILERLNQKNQAYEVFHLTETVLTLTHPNQKDELVNILRTNQKDWDWGNWSESFRKLFKKYDIEID
tara:strand:+ start:36479 stop:37876 length:1398 start_codon:yes stop_codon:yes gene_type:complete